MYYQNGISVAGLYRVRHKQWPDGPGPEKKSMPGKLIGQPLACLDQTQSHRPTGNIVPTVNANQYLQQLPPCHCF